MVYFFQKMLIGFKTGSEHLVPDIKDSSRKMYDEKMENGNI